MPNAKHPSDPHGDDLPDGPSDEMSDELAAELADWSSEVDWASVEWPDETDQPRGNWHPEGLPQAAEAGSEGLVPQQAAAPTAGDLDRPATPQECSVAMWAHLGPLLVVGGAVLLALVLPSLGFLMVFAWLVPLAVRERLGADSAFVSQHATEALNFQLTLLGVLISGMVLIFVLVGALLLAGGILLMLIFAVTGAMAASRGARYAYPVAIRFVK